jgi:hypothetical protein
MRWLSHLAVWLYPCRWRARYAAELHALIDDAPPGWAALVDVMRGGVFMRMRTSNVGLMAVSLGIVGALLGGIRAYAAPPRFESRGTIAAQGTADPGELDRALRTALERAADSAFGADAVRRADIAVTLTPAAHEVQVAYADADPQRARDMTQRLMTHAIEAHLLSAPPSADRASGVQLRINMPPDLPETASRPMLGWLISVGFGGGAILGAAIGAWRRRARPGA